MKRLLRAAVRYGMRQGWSRGVLDGQRSWIVVGGIALVSHLAGRALGRDVDVVFSEKIAPGESFTVTHLPRP
ncbi:MAG TPA: hypothetical protein VFP61_16050 [Acidimicrobiales bacterium]|nr:hypothetical protein [Acidimicrobiales bacterium]